MKRLFTLTLILTLLVTCVAFPVSAAQSAGALPFSDADRITNYAELTIFHELGVISGVPGGAFQPQRNLTRAEVAVLVCRLGGLSSDAALTATDLSAGYWATEQIACVVDQGLMSLLPDGRFQPELAITVRDFSRTLLLLLGYEIESDAQLETLIDQTKLLSGFFGGLDSFVTRDDSCLLMYNAASCYQIADWKDGEPVYYTDSLLNPTTLLERCFGLTRYTELLTANEYADLVLSGGRLEKGYTKLAEHRAFQVSTGLEYVGRRVDIFVRDGKVVGLPHIHTDETCLSFENYLDYETYLLNNGFEVSDETEYYFNYAASDRCCLIGDYDRCEIVCVDSDNDRVLELVLVVACDEATFTSAAPVRLEFADGTSQMIPGDYVIYGRVEVGDTVYAVRVSGVWHIFAKTDEE